MDDVARKEQLWREHMARLGAMSAEQKLEAAAAARRRSLELLRAGVRHRQPNWPPEQVEDEVLRLIFGDEMRERFRERYRRRGLPASH